MVTHIVCDIFEPTLKLDCILHCCNCFNTMGSGIALEISKRFPEAKEVDLQTKKGDNKLGLFSKTINTDPIIYNLYGQYSFGGNHRQLNYEGLYQALEKVKEDLDDFEGDYTIGIPYKMGCDRAGGDWNIVRAMIDSVFANTGFDVLICELPE